MRLQLVESLLVDLLGNVRYLYELLHHLQGAGLLGLYASILFKEAGYKEIFCSDIHHDRLDMAAKFGALPIKLGEV